MIGVCAVVGCGPGLGGSAAIKFAREGFAIAAFNRTPETFAPTKDQLESIGAKYDSTCSQECLRRGLEHFRKD
jgi:NAD(P)-dependent dehydrogenase (short-subunit alcohol dehydrogenase family)